MMTVVGVKFKRIGKVYFFDPSELEYQEGDHVIVETARGIEFGELAFPPREVPDDQVIQPLKKVVRIADERDAARVQSNEEKEKRAVAIAEEIILKLKLDMKLVNVECTFDGSRMVFYFTADGRVDFRELIKELAQRFHTRIELKQIGVRDETKMMGGLGPCGREICCTSFMADFHPVSIRMAKEQNISLNPTKISGLCGRLMCCLQFEYDQYRRAAQTMPHVGSDLVTPDGPGVSVENDLLQQKIRVRVTMPDHSLEMRTYLIDDLRTMTPDEREDAYLHPERYTTTRAISSTESDIPADDMMVPLRIRGDLVENKSMSSGSSEPQEDEEGNQTPAGPTEGKRIPPRPSQQDGQNRRRSFEPGQAPHVQAESRNPSAPRPTPRPAQGDGRREGDAPIRAEGSPTSNQPGRSGGRSRHRRSRPRPQGAGGAPQGKPPENV